MSAFLAVSVADCGLQVEKRCFPLCFPCFLIQRRPLSILNFNLEAASFERLQTVYNSTPLGRFGVFSVKVSTFWPEDPCNEVHIE